MTADPNVILSKRARKLAMAVVATENATIEPMLSFTLGDERFLAPLRSVREVAAPNSITRIPGLPFVFAGLTTIRGDLIPVLDIRAFLGLPEQRPERPKWILIIESEGTSTGVWVDQLHGLVAVDSAHLTADHGLTSAAFRGRTSDLSTVIDVTAVAAAAGRSEFKLPAQEA